MARNRLRLLGLLVCLLSLGAFTCPVFGQGVLGSGWPSLSSLGSCTSRLGDPEFFVGWADHWRGATFDNTANEEGVPGPLISFVRYMGSKRSYPVRGLWLELSETVHLSERAYMTLNGSYLIPSNGRAQEDYQFLVFIFPDLQERSWSTKVQWWAVDAAFAWRYNCSWSVLVGLRRDSFSTKFGDTQAMEGLLGRTRGLPSDESELTMDSWIPYVGLVMDQRPGPTSLRVGVIGFPAFPAHVRYADTISSVGIGPAVLTRLEASGGFNTGYFLEVFAEYARSMKNLQAGIFAKWTVAHGTGDLDMDASYAGFPGTMRAFSLSFDRQAWILGGKLTLGFVSPL